MTSEINYSLQVDNIHVHIYMCIVHLMLCVINLLKMKLNSWHVNNATWPKSHKHML